MGVIILVWSPRIVLSNFLTDAGHRARDKLIDAADNVKGKRVISLLAVSVQCVLHLDADSHMLPPEPVDTSRFVSLGAHFYL